MHDRLTGRAPQQRQSMRRANSLMLSVMVFSFLCSDSSSDPEYLQRLQYPSFPRRALHDADNNRFAEPRWPHRHLPYKSNKYDENARWSQQVDLFSLDDFALAHRLTGGKMSNNNSNLTIRLGLELSYGDPADWVLDLDFSVVFNASGNASSGSKYYMCEDRGERCLPDELRFQMRDPSSKLFRVLQNGRLSRLLAASHLAGLPQAQDAQTITHVSQHLFERRSFLPSTYLSSRHLLQTPAQPTVVQKSPNIRFLETALQLQLMGVSRATVLSLLSGMSTIRNGAQAALLDLTSRQSNLRPVDAIKTQADVLIYLDLAMTRLGELKVFPVAARNHVINMLYTITQAAFCTLITVESGFEKGNLILDAALLSDRVKVKTLCLSDNIADSTYPLRAAEGPKPDPCDEKCELFQGGRLAAIQRLVNKAGIYSTLYGEDATQKQALEQGARPASLDADVGIVAAPGSPAGVPAPLEVAAASPVSATWLKSFRIPPSGTRPASLRFLPCHLDDDGRWVIPGSLVSVTVEDMAPAPEAGSDVTGADFYGCDEGVCPTTTIIVASYPSAYNPFATYEPAFPSNMPYTASLNPYAYDILTDVHILKLEGGVWDLRRAKGTLYVQVNFSSARPVSDPLRPNDVFTSSCVQFSVNESRWTEDGCTCLDRKCMHCNCSYALIDDVAQESNATETERRRQQQRRQNAADDPVTSGEDGPKMVQVPQDFISIALRRKKTCQTVVVSGFDDEEVELECSGHGVCDLGNCKCQDQWAGPMCNSSCVDCNGHGSCSKADGRCLCFSGWAGPQCTIQPDVAGFVPPYLPPIALTTIDVVGTGFGDTDSTPAVKIGDTDCRSSVWLGSTRIRCRVAPGVGERYPVIVYSGGLSDNSGAVTTTVDKNGVERTSTASYFSYSAPVITDLDPVNGPTTGRFLVTITGRNFGNHWNERMVFDGVVKFSQSLCSPQQWLSDSSLRCSVPGGQGRNVPVLIQIPAGHPRENCLGEYIDNVTTYFDSEDERCGVCEGCRTFNYDPPVIKDLYAGMNKKPETYRFRGPFPDPGPCTGGPCRTSPGEVMTVIGTNFGKEAEVAVGPDPTTGVIYYCNFTKPFAAGGQAGGCVTIGGVDYQCLFCALLGGGGAYPITVWLAGQRSVTDVPFKFRGRAVGLAFHEKPSKMVSKDGFLEKQPTLKVIDDLNDDEPMLRPNEEFNFDYWVGPEDSFQEFNPDGAICFVQISRVPDSSNPLENPCTDEFEDEMKKDPSKVGTTACFEADMPLHRNYERGVGLQDRVEFRSAENGMAVFSDIQFIGHPSQQYNITFTVVNLGNEQLVGPKTLSTSWLVDFTPCPSGQLGTWDRKCECARGFEVGGASGCARCDGGSAELEGDQTDEHGRYKPEPGPQSCTKCPSRNMITKNSTTRDSVGTCFCSKGFFRAAVLYDYNTSYTPEPLRPSTCGKNPLSYVLSQAAEDLPDAGRRLLRERRRRRRGSRRQGNSSGEDEVCVYGWDGAEDTMCSEWELQDGDQLQCNGAIEFESVDCGRVRGYVAQDSSVAPDDDTCSNLGANDPKICTKCRSLTGCRGDKYGIGIQGCAQNYKGIMCALCDRGFYSQTNGDCSPCPSNDQVVLTISLITVGLVVGGAIALRYMSLIKMLADPPSVKIFAAYLIITSSVSTSYQVDLPKDYESYQGQTSFIQLDIQGVLYCMIQEFEFTYYHNIVLQASLPFVVSFLALAALTFRFSMIQTHFDAKRRQDRKGLLTDKINTQEEAAKINAQEMIISGASQALVLIHPTVTMTMIRLFSCTPVLGYRREWLRADVRYQCADSSHWVFAIVAISVIFIFTVGLPVFFFVQLVRRRHRLDEAQAIVRRRYQGWRKRVKEKVVQRRVALLRGLEPDPLKDPEEESMINRDLLSCYQIYYAYVREWDQLLFLHRDFTLDRFYWELVEVVRKLLLVSVVVIVGNYAPGYDLVFGIINLFGFFALHLYALPYKRGKHNFLKAAEMFAEYMTLFVTLMLLLAKVIPTMDTTQMGKAMLALQGFLGVGMVIVVFVNLKEGIQELKRQKEQEEGLGVVARVEQVSIYSVFFAINLISGLIRRCEAKRLDELDEQGKAARSAHATRQGEIDVKKWESLVTRMLAGDADGDEMLLQHALKEHGADDDDDMDASDQASEGSVMSLDMLSDEMSSTSLDLTGSASSESEDSASDAQHDQDEKERNARQTAGGGNFSEEGVGIDRMDCI